MKRSFEEWLDTCSEVPIHAFYINADDHMVYALYQDAAGYVVYNDISPHAEPERMIACMFYQQYQPFREDKSL